MNEEQTKRAAQLRQAFEQGILDQDTYQTALAALAAPAPDPHTTAADRGVAVGGNLQETAVVTGDNNSVTYIRTVYLQAPGRAELDEPAFDQALARYLDWVNKRFGQLSLRGIERREQQVLSLTLADVYVSLVATLSPERKAQGRRGRDEPMLDEMHAEPVAMNRLLTLGGRLMIVGGPGSGKTTYLHIIASALANALRSSASAAAQDNLGLSDPLPLPILVSLSEFNNYRKQLSASRTARDGTLIAFISHWLIRQETAIGLPADFFERLLMQGRSCILLLDGLDEVANERERVLVSRAVENVANNAGLRQIVVTCRTRAHRGDAVLPEEFRVAEVQSMSPKQVDALAARWCGAAYPALDAANETQRLQKAIRRMEEVRTARNETRLIETPLLVTIVAIVHYNQRRLPDERAELYEKCVEVLLAEKHHPASDTTYALADWGGSLADKRNLLAYLAFQMMSAGEAAGRSVSEGQLEGWLRPQLARKHGQAQADAQVTTFIAAMRERGSLLEERGGDYRFIHLTFQEYLCAYYLAESLRQLDKIVTFLAGGGRIAQSWWRETVLLVVGYLGLRSQENALTLVRRLAECDGSDALALAASEVAASAFLELDSQDGEVQGKLITYLVAQLSRPELTVTGALRAAAGRALGHLGDPRPGVGVKPHPNPPRSQGGSFLPDIVWQPVEAGPFVMGGKENYEGERRFTCRLIRQPYQISRYPVTVAQYHCFVAAQGYDQQKYWSKAGWQWRTENRITGPERYGGVFEIANHPQVGVSWYEAVAFCAWLSEQTAKVIRLPTEAEWERAARHSDGRVYPWGNEDEYSTRCNMSESGIDSSTAVGIFPSGNALCGAADLAGNVWEWCSTRWQEDYVDYERKVNDDPAGAAGRVLRGGSFALNRNLVRCASRLRSKVDYRGRRYGFRLVWSPGG